jgi:hypothetical protein
VSFDEVTPLSLKIQFQHHVLFFILFNWNDDTCLNIKAFKKNKKNFHFKTFKNPQEREKCKKQINLGEKL